MGIRINNGDGFGQDISGSSTQSFIWDEDLEQYVSVGDFGIFVGPEDPTTADGGRDVPGDIWINPDERSVSVYRVEGDQSGNLTKGTGDVAQIVPATLTFPASPGDEIEIIFQGHFTNSTSGGGPSLRFYIDGVAVGPVEGSLRDSTLTSAGASTETGVLLYTIQPGDITNGTVTVDCYWTSTNGTTTLYNTSDRHWQLSVKNFGPQQ